MLAEADGVIINIDAAAFLQVLPESGGAALELAAAASNSLLSS
jgi:hypothetical protein